MSYSKGNGDKPGIDVARLAQATKHSSRKAADIAKEKAKEGIILTKEAADRGAWIWPLRGQYYLVTHPKLLKPVLLALITSTAFTVCVTIALFVFTYLPTVAVLAFFNGPLAFLTAVLVIKAEAAAIAITVSKIFWLRGAQDRLFDEVLIHQGLTDLVSVGDQTKKEKGSNKKPGKVLEESLGHSSKEFIAPWLVSFPLFAIPIIGPACWLLYNGARSGSSYHERYFQLKSLQEIPRHTSQDRAARATKENMPTWNEDGPAPAFDKKKLLEEREGSYLVFGAVATALDVLIPGGAVFCMLGNQAGAALWAAEMEKQDEGIVGCEDKE